jgi:hypothetical protein
MKAPNVHLAVLSVQLQIVSGGRSMPQSALRPAYDCAPLCKGLVALGLVDLSVNELAFLFEMLDLRLIGQARIATRTVPLGSESPD